MEELGFIAVLVCILASAAISRRIQGTIITLPMVYTVLGLLIGRPVLDLLELDVNGEVLRLIAELTLVLVLASDASRINVRLLRKDHTLPARLLSVGLLLTMLFGALIAFAIFPELGFWGAAILGVLLAPTDASLGQAVVTNAKIPMRVRQTLNIESGLNDGIAVPFLIMAISLAVASDEALAPTAFVIGALGAIALGVLGGVIVGWLGAKFVLWGQRSGWMSREFSKISAVALVFLAYAVAEVIGGNGFIAAFIMGMVVGDIWRDGEAEVYEHIEAEVALLVLVTFLFFGAVLLPDALDGLDGRVLLYALFSLTLIRMAPVAISLTGVRLAPTTVAFIGWFGPRGTASILYIFTVLEAEGLDGKALIYDVAMITVFLSIILHGVTAAPAAERYGGRMADPDSPENQDVAELPLRTHGTFGR